MTRNQTDLKEIVDGDGYNNAGQFIQTWQRKTKDQQ